MENRINVAELLKDCPSGMELDCTMFDNVTLLRVANIEGVIYPITVLRGDGNSMILTKYGQCADANSAKCVIFPKGKTTWEGFKIPFKIPFIDGDIVATESGRWIGITTGGEKTYPIPTYCVIMGWGEFEAYFGTKRKWMFDRLATEEEKEKLFQAIKANGYKWNERTKTLEKLIKPKFKVGDKIVNDDYVVEIIDMDIEGEVYGYKSKVGATGGVLFIEQDEWELVPNRFDITTLKPFESKVLVRDDDDQRWTGEFYSSYNVKDDYPFHCILFGRFKQCIPYEGNEHLLDKDDACDPYYKTWP